MHDDKTLYLVGIRICVIHLKYFKRTVAYYLAFLYLWSYYKTRTKVIYRNVSQSSKYIRTILYDYHIYIICDLPWPMRSSFISWINWCLHNVNILLTFEFDISKKMYISEHKRAICELLGHTSFCEKLASFYC